MKTIRALGLGLAAAFLAAAIVPTSHAQDAQGSTGDYFTKALPLDLKRPTYPQSAARKYLEGWAIASFRIKLDGTVDNVEIIESSGQGVFEKSAAKAIKSWTFQPATLNGKPIETCQKEYQITYQLDEIVGARKWFRKPYKRAMDLIKKGEYSAARDEITAMRNNNKGLNMYELARLDLIEGQVLFQQGQLDSALPVLQGAVAGKEFIEKDAVERAYEVLFMTQINLKRYGDAYRTYQTLASNYRKVLKNPAMARAGQELIQLAHGASGFATDLRIAPDRSTVNHRMMRRKFGFSDVSGELQTFKVFCDRNFFSAPVNTKDAWTLPEGWGACSVAVNGSAGTTFKIAEY